MIKFILLCSGRLLTDNWSRFVAAELFTPISVVHIECTLQNKIQYKLCFRSMSRLSDLRLGVRCKE